MYFIYHIFDGKVGMTKNIQKRVVEEQGCRADEFEILGEFETLIPALKAEQEHNERLGYKKTPEWHPDLKNMKNIYKYNSGVSVTLEHDYRDQEQLKFIDKDGTEYNFTDTSLIPTQIGRYPEGNPKPFVYWKALRNAYQEQERLVSKRQQNNCSSLKVESTDVSIDDVFDLQKSLQMKFPETKDIGNMSIADTAIAAQRNWHAFTDEMMEFMDALGGVNDGFGNGAWKYWKKDFQKAKEMKISDLSEADLLELKFEFVDMFHFFINFGLMIGMTGQEMIDMYVSKNKENFERQKRGY